MPKHLINPVLFDVAAWRASGEREKKAFVPTGADPMAGAMPPGAPPVDPMMGGAPPMDPSMMGGMPPAAPPVDPMAAAAGMPPAAPAAAPAGAPGAAAGGKAKIDPAFIYLELGRVRKLLTHLLQSTGIDLPPDILDDGSVAQVMQGQPPESAPLGSEPPPAAAGGGGAQLPGIGGASAVGPVAAPGGGGGGEKAGSDVLSLFMPTTPADARPDFGGLANRIDALSALSRRLGEAG